MKKVFITLTALLLVFGLSSAVSALQLSGVDGDWGDVSGAATTTYVKFGSENQVRWTTSGGTGISGHGFTGSAPPSQTFNVGEVFEVGQLRHYNNPTNSATSADLSITLSVSNPSIAGDYDFDFSLNENRGSTAGGDYISVADSYASQSYNVGGIDYTLQFIGFGNSENDLIQQFETPGSVISSTSLFGKITTAAGASQTPGAHAAPEPASIILLGFGISGLLGFGRKKFFKK